VKQTAAVPEHGQKTKNTTAISSTQLISSNQAFLIANPMLGAFHSPPITNRNDILQLQSLVGNQAVNDLVGQQHVFFNHEQVSVPQAFPSIQRQETRGNQAASANRDASADAELDAILATIPSPPQVPAFEAITSTTGGEYSKTEWEEAMQKSWQRHRFSFTQTARQVAGTEEPNRPLSTEGPRVTPTTPYAKRWTLNLIANNYRRGKPLAHIAGFLKKGSPFERSQAAESDRVINVQDPTGSAMRSNITDAIMGLFAALPEGQIGELVVYYSGHGTEGRIYGVDWKVLSPGELESLANFARDWNVHIVYIIDSCRSGGFVVLSQAQALKDAQERFKKLPADKQKKLTQQAEAAHDLGSQAFMINRKTVQASEVLRYIKAYTPGNRMKMMRTFNILSKEANELSYLFREGKIQAGLVKNQPELEKAIGDLTMGILVAFSGGSREANRVLRYAAVLLDTLNTAINTLIEQINSQLGPISP
jgi:hypothetical protein